MNELADLIDRLPPPQIPSAFSAADQQLIQLMLTSAKQQVRPYSGNFEAIWLLVPFGDDVWFTTNRGREELINGVWKNAIIIDWHVQLPNGCLLTDARYSVLLTTVKKVSFLMRSNLICGMSAPQSWLGAVYSLFSIVRWVVLHEDRFQPETYGLGMIDQPALDWLISEYAQGGLMQMLQIPQRSLAAFYRGAHGSDCPVLLMENSYALPPAEIQSIVRWIESQGGYAKPSTGRHKEKRSVHRPWLGRLIDEDIRCLTSRRLSRFCRQFEQDFSGSSLLVTIRQKTEYPSHRAELSSDEREGTTANSVKQLTHLFRSILAAHHHVPDSLPDPAGLSLYRAMSLAQKFIRSDGHTPFMPVNTGLAYLNVAIGFVHRYGEAIIGLYLAVVSSLPARSKDRDAANNDALKRYANAWCIASGEPITKVLHITQFNGEAGRQNRCDFHRYRSNPTLEEALRVLIGSCIVCMALLKPSREEELTYLKRNCLRVDANGYWFNFDLGKSNPKGVEAWQEADRPIPVIAAKGIQLLQHLGDRLCDIFGGTKKHSGNLFYLPRTDGHGALAANTWLLNDHLDDFCDFVGLPTDIEGRRWYVRIHEMRKWFLLLLFWSGRFDVLDAARWIAGHTDAAHIYAYIEKEFPGESLPQIEAQYSEERLRRLAKGESGNEDGANVLYEAVLKHFNVESLTMIPDTEWTGYVRALREADKFHLEPHSIWDEDGSVVGINVSFVIRELP